MIIAGSVDRGTKVFRYASWESAQVYNQLIIENLNSVPVFGHFASGSFHSSFNESANLMETDSVYSIITLGPHIDSELQSDIVASTEHISLDYSFDMLSSFESKVYSDINDKVIVRKRDTLSSHAVRVSTMEFGLPEKAPQPANTLESIVWDRERDLDRMRERYPLARALILAKQAEKKFPQKNFLTSIINKKDSFDGINIILSLHRSSLNGGRFLEAVDLTSIAEMARSITQMSGKINRIVAIGCQTESSIYKGQFEDITSLRSIDLPVLCDDFVLYGYQLFRARECGADMVRLHMAILPIEEAQYLLKTARALNMQAIMTVSSKPQLLDLLRLIQGVEMISITSRNMRLWKVI